MLPPGFNWNNNFPLAHGNDTFSLPSAIREPTSTNPVLQTGMQGVVIVHPAGTSYPFSQEQYSTQARQELRADLTAGRQALASFKPPESTQGPGNTETHFVSAGTNAPETATVRLAPTEGSTVRGKASLAVLVSSAASTMTVKVRLSGLIPDHVYSTSINFPSDQFFIPSGNATSYDGQSFFNSGGLHSLDTFVLTFTTPGAFPYTNPLQARMSGTIIVEATASDE